MELFIDIAINVTLPIVSIAALGYLMQARMLYLAGVPGRSLDHTPADIGAEYRDEFIETADGVRLHGWYVPGDSDRVLLFFHGNAGNASQQALATWATDLISRTEVFEAVSAVDIDRLELEIDDLCIEALARFQPIARDLRFITTAMKITRPVRIASVTSVVKSSLPAFTLRLTSSSRPGS